MEKLSRLSAEDRDNLPAYLDGELDDDSTRRIETILAQSSVARNDIEALSKTYELLDELPRPTAPGDFLEKTVATAKLEEVKPSLVEQPWFRAAQQYGALSLWTAALLFAGIVGFTATNRLLEREDDILVREFPLLQQLDVYSEVQSVEFLDQLTADEKLLEELRKATSHE